LPRSVEGDRFLYKMVRRIVGEVPGTELVQKPGFGLPEPQLAERRRFIGHNIG
jgi:hypothetical protein